MNIDNAEITDPTQFIDEDAGNNPYIIKVIGVGGGGCNAVERLHRENIASRQTQSSDNTSHNFSLVACNTDYDVLRNCSVPEKLYLGKKGRGAGNKVERGREIAEESSQVIIDNLNDRSEMVFVTSGLGGGTGTGAAPIVARLAKEAGKLTVGVVTLPFEFEGKQKRQIALNAVEDMRKNVDALIVINNQNLIEHYQNVQFDDGMNEPDRPLVNAVNSIAEIVYANGVINVDFEDIKTALEDSKTAIISTGYGEGENRISKAIENAINSPMLSDCDISSTKRLVLFFWYPKSMGVGELQQLSKFTNGLSDNLWVKWGYGKDDSLGDKVKISILLTGFRSTLNTDISQNYTEEESQIDEINDNTQRFRVPSYMILTPETMDDDKVINSLEHPPYMRNNDDRQASDAINRCDNDKPSSTTKINNRTIVF